MRAQQNHLSAIREYTLNSVGTKGCRCQDDTARAYLEHDLATTYFSIIIFRDSVVCGVCNS